MSSKRKARRKRGSRTPEPAARPGSSREPARELHKLTDLVQMKVLADPLRIRLLELFGEERTTKQVAEILGLPPTRLYHHVAALERVGLIRLARTQQRRGAMEKYYLAVAKTFSADSRLFSSGKPRQVLEAARGVATQILENTSADMGLLLEQGQGLTTLKEDAVLSYLEVRGSPAELKAIRARIMKLIKSTEGSRSQADATVRAYRLTIAYFPLVKSRPGS
jgi:DNA-binding transcriptional ArsR family regulator